MQIRKSVFAGNWYPGDAAGCEREIKTFLEEGQQRPDADRSFIGGIVPHAGWYFSGSIACNVLHWLQDEEPVDVVVIFGMHLHPASPSYIMDAGAWETPFGPIEIEQTMAGELAKQFNFRIETADNFTQDNTIELVLPFVKYFFKDAKLVPMGVPPNQKTIQIGRAVADISTRLGRRVKVIGSTDLTHYGNNYGFVVKGTGQAAVDWVRNENDRRVIDAMLAMDPDSVISEALENQNACCGGAAAAAIAAAKQLGAQKAQSIAYATSYDKSPGDSFVGYVGIVF